MRTDKKIKVLHILWSGASGGAERFVLDLVSFSDRELFEHRVCFCSGGGPISDRIEKGGTRVACLGMKSGRDFLGGVKIFKILRDFQPDLIQVHSTSLLINFFICRFSKIPKIYLELGDILVRPGGSRTFYKYFGKFYQMIIPNSRFTRDLILRSTSVPPDRVGIFYIGIDHESARSSNMNLKKELGLPPGGKVIGSVGRLVEAKGYDDFIKAAARIQRANPDVNFLLIGDGPLRPALEKQAEEAGVKIHFAGDRQNIMDLIKVMDVFLFTSKYESFGIVILEALSAGVPVLGFSAGGAPEITAGGGGILIENRDIDRLAEITLDLLAADKKRMELGRAGRENVRINFNIRDSIKVLENIYLSQVATPPGGLAGGMPKRENIFDISNRPLVVDTFKTTVLAIIGKSFTFLIPFFIAAWFGISSETDSLFFSYGIIIFFAAMFVPAIEGIIVPFIAELRAKNEDPGKLINEILGMGTLGLLGFLIFLLLILKMVLPFITNFNPAQLNMTYKLLIESGPLFILLILNGVLSGSLNAYKKFSLPALSPLFGTLVNLIIIFLLKDRFGIAAIIYGYNLGEFIRFLILLATIRRLKLFVFSYSFKISHIFKTFVGAAFFQTLGMMAMGFNPIVDRTMASWLGTGNVSILEYSSRLYMFAVTFMSMGLMVTILSHWSERFFNYGLNSLAGDISKVLKLVILTAFLIMLVLLIFRKPIIVIAYQRGNFPAGRISELTGVWAYYLLGYVPYMAGFLYTRVHLVIKNVSVFVKYGLLSTILNIIFNLIFMRILGIRGIALSSTVVSWIMFFCLYYELEKKFKELP